MAAVAPIGKEEEQVGLAAQQSAPPQVAVPISPQAGGGVKLKRNTTDEALKKVLDPTKKTDGPIDPRVEMFVKMKLLQWDKDQNGTFTPNEVHLAMQDLQDSEAAMANLKWRFIGCFLFVFLFLVFTVSTMAIVFAVTKTTDVPASGEMRAKNPDSKKPGQTELVMTAASKSEINLMNMLNFSADTDQWLITEDQLRDMDQVNFWGVNNTFYNLEVAEVIRIDSGKLGTLDKLELQTTGGVKLRVWEDTMQLEVLWFNQTMWHGVNMTSSSTGGRRLLAAHEEHYPEWTHVDDMMHDDAEEDIMNYEIDHTKSTHERRLGKGGVVFFYGGVHSYNRGGGGSGCGGWCNVPYGSSSSCSQYCPIGACYSYGGNTYMCNSAFRTFFGPSWLLHAIAAVLLISGAWQE